MGSSLQPVAVNKAAAEVSPGAREIKPDTTLGNVVECRHSHEQQGCGKTIHCSGCVLRKTMEATNETGDPAFMVPATVSTETEDVTLYVSTIKADGRIFVKLDKIEPS